MVNLSIIEQQIKSTTTPVCLSGGAKGSDEYWGEFAAASGHAVYHWSFQGHRSTCDTKQIYRLNESQLKDADDYLERANLALSRRIPYSKPWIVNLLRRNWYQVRWTQSLYAVSTFSRSGMVEGGTAWAVQMYLDRYIYDNESMDDCRAYVYDQTTKTWKQWQVDRWIDIDVPPPPQGIWTGIGTRDLSEAGEHAIASLF